MTSPNLLHPFMGDGFWSFIPLSSLARRSLFHVSALPGFDRGYGA